MNFQKIIIAIFFSCSVFIVLGQQTIPPLPVSKDGFIVIAHRGGHLVKPENTVAAIEEAIKAGADYTEMDLRTTRDGYLVLCHNSTVDETTNGKGRVSDLTWNEIHKLDVVNKEGKQYRIPEFRDALKACKGRINIYLDFKDADVAEAYRQIKAAGMEKHVVVYLNKPEQYPAWRKIAPAMPLMTSLPESVKTEADLRAFLKRMQIEVFDNITDSKLLAAARKNGVSVWLDVEGADENPAKWSSAIHLGIQGMQTDHPGALVKYLKQNKLRNGL
ncbi:MAG: glycerophosphodiester phosphodiesterase family protein [Bacteroidota bacterium]|nr:glycerophosphodiester phosphodiesterase family protein [Bacteroidota bacterium]